MTDFNAIVNAHAAAQARVSKPVTPRELTRDQWVYRGWQIYFDMPPIPSRAFDWHAVHPNYDASYEGPEDGWVDNGLQVFAGTYEDLLAEIDEKQAELDEGDS